MAEEEEAVTYDERFYYPDGTKKDLDGLKELWKRRVNNQARSLLTDTDWYVVRKSEADKAIPDNISTYRAAVRTKANAMCVQIDASNSVDTLAQLYVYNTDEPPVRPLGELPTV